MTVQDTIDPLRRQHLDLREEQIMTPEGRTRVLINDGESPLIWLARRKGRDGKALIAPHQLLAGERLRLDFTRAHLMPRTTTNWDNAIPLGRGTGNPAAHINDVMVASRQRVRHALDAVGPEFSGLLVDVCCFLKKLDDLERERSWPARSAKIVLQLGLDRLARHYGFDAEVSGRAGAVVRTWLADDAEFTVEVSSGGS